MNPIADTSTRDDVKKLKELCEQHLNGKVSFQPTDKNRSELYSFLTRFQRYYRVGRKL